MRKRSQPCKGYQTPLDLRDPRKTEILLTQNLSRNLRKVYHNVLAPVQTQETSRTVLRQVSLIHDKDAVDKYVLDTHG